MRADNSRYIVAAARNRHEHTRTKAIQALREIDAAGTAATFDAVARAAGVSRSWLYTQQDLRAEIERLRTERNVLQPTPSRPGSGPPTPHSFDAWKLPTNATADSPRKTASSGSNSPVHSVTCAPPGCRVGVEHASQNVP